MFEKLRVIVNIESVENDMNNEHLVIIVIQLELKIVLNAFLTGYRIDAKVRYPKFSLLSFYIRHNFKVCSQRFIIIINHYLLKRDNIILGLIIANLVTKISKIPPHH